MLSSHLIQRQQSTLLDLWVLGRCLASSACLAIVSAAMYSRTSFIRALFWLIATMRQSRQSPGRSEGINPFAESLS